MGKQSARLVYQGQDYKDIFYEGSYHDKLYYKGELVWEKLYPEKCFVTTNEFRNVMAENSGKPYDRYDTLMFNADEVCVKKQVPWYTGDNNYSIEAYSDSAILCVIGRKSYAVAKDLIHFKLVQEFGGKVIGTVGDGFVTRLSSSGESEIRLQILTIKDDDMNCDIKDIDTGFAGNLFSYHGCIFAGNYIVAGASHSDAGTLIYNYITVDKDGNIKKTSKHFDDVTMEWAYEINFFNNSIFYGFEIVLGNYAYYSVANRAYERRVDGKYKTIYTTEKIIRRNLNTFGDMTLKDYGNKERRYFHYLYKSSNKCVLVGTERDIDSPNAGWHAFITTIGEEIILDYIQKLSIKVYGEERSIDIVSIAGKGQEILKDVICLFDSDGLRVHEEVIGTLSTGLPTLKKEKVQLDVINGMLFEFTYGKSADWYIRGYMYIDNFTFAESENNYIYILEEYENNQKTFERIN